MTTARSVDQVLDAAAERYRAAGRSAYYFVRGKLRYDPVYRWILERRLLDGSAPVLDLGCGRGILLSVLVEDGGHDAAHCGIDRSAWALAVARTALPETVRLRAADASDVALPASGAIVILDVLHYLPAPIQEDLLRRAAAALRPGGLLLVREADAAAGRGFHRVRWAERLRSVGRGHLAQRFHYRSAADWTALLSALGLATRAHPIGAGTPFANVLLESRSPAIG
jgi:SAM-dependent methyltransferase